MPTCQICARTIKLKDGPNLAHHGYQRPGSGWQTASCWGARELPYEVSCDVLKRWVIELAKQRDAARGRAEGTVEKLYLKVASDWRKARHDPTRETYETVTEATLGETLAKYPRMGDYHGAAYKPLTWAHLVERYRHDQRTQAEHAEMERRDQQARLDAWKPPAEQTASAD